MEHLLQKALFSPQECLQFLTVIRTCRAKRTSVVKTGTHQVMYDEESRKAFGITVPEAIQNRITYRLMSLKPMLEDFFQVELQGCHAPLFLAYQAGDFFERHRDAYTDPEWLIQVRRLSAVLFLNTFDVADGYTGGELMLYPPGTLPKAAESRAIEAGQAQPKSPEELGGERCLAQAGDLVVFRPEQVHEVLPVKTGIRYTVVNWFY